MSEKKLQPLWLAPTYLSQHMNLSFPDIRPRCECIRGAAHFGAALNYRASLRGFDVSTDFQGWRHGAICSGSGMIKCIGRQYIWICSQWEHRLFMSRGGGKRGRCTVSYLGQRVTSAGRNWITVLMFFTQAFPCKIVSVYCKCTSIKVKWKIKWVYFYVSTLVKSTACTTWCNTWINSHKVVLYQI